MFTFEVAPHPSMASMILNRKRRREGDVKLAEKNGAKTTSNTEQQHPNDEISYFEAVKQTSAAWNVLIAMKQAMQDKHSELVQRQKDLEARKVELAEKHGGATVSPKDKLKLNVGGVRMVALRETLTQFPDTRLAALFSGRWESCLARDKNKRIFLDVNPACFEQILSYHQLCKVAGPEELVELPTMPPDMQFIMQKQLSFFGLVGNPFDQDQEQDQDQDQDHHEEVRTSTFKPGVTFDPTYDAWNNAAGVDRPLADLKAAFAQERNILNAALKRQAWMEDCFAVEERFVSYFCDKNVSDVIDLDVSGKHVSVARSTLMICEGSVLASKFNTQWKQDEADDDDDDDEGNSGALIEHSSYCFGKIIDQMRLKRMFPAEAGNLEPPAVVSHERVNFERIVKYFFPGQESFIFGETKTRFIWDVNKRRHKRRHGEVGKPA